MQTTNPEDPDQDAKAGLAFFAILILYGQLLTYGFWVATGVVEEKSSRVIEILLATIRPKDLLAGKVLGLGLLGLGQLLIVSLLGLVVAAATGALDVDADLIVAIALSLGWFVLGYAFYASAYAVAGALVPRQEEIQSSTTPLTMLILISLFVGFAVNDDPDGTLAHVTAFLPPVAPVTMPSRIILGAAPAWEIAASAALMLIATLTLIPFAGRIYAAVVLRTGSAVKLREAIRLRARELGSRPCSDAAGSRTGCGARPRCSSSGRRRRARGRREKRDVEYRFVLEVDGRRVEHVEQMPALKAPLLGDVLPVTVGGDRLRIEWDEVPDIADRARASAAAAQAGDAAGAAAALGFTLRDK